MLPTEHSRSAPSAGALAGEQDSFFAPWTRFWFTPVQPTGLHWLRFFTGLLLICWLLPLAGDIEGLFGADGWFSYRVGSDFSAFKETRALRRTDNDPGAALTTWSILFAVGGNSGLLHLTFWAAIGVFALFALGIATRITGVLTWVMVGSFLINPASSFDADYLLVIPALYLMLGYLLLGQWSRDLTPLERVLGPRGTSIFSLLSARRDAAPPSHAAGLAIRLLQVHFALVIVTSALHKLQFAAWWSGVAFWYPLSPPGTSRDVLEGRALSDSFLITISLAQYIVLAWQLGFPLFAWRTGLWRILLLGGAVAGWFGSAGMFGLPLFGPVYLLCCLSYLTPAEWSRFADVFGNLGGWVQQQVPARTEKIVRQPASTHVTRR